LLWVGVSDPQSFGHVLETVPGYLLSVSLASFFSLFAWWYCFSSYTFVFSPS